MHPSLHATTTPDKPAVIMAGSGLALSYGELDAASNRGAQLFREFGLRRGDAVAVMLENCPAYFEIVWAAQRAGLYLVAVSSRLTAGEASYIVQDSGARLFITSDTTAANAGLEEAPPPDVTCFWLAPAAGPFRDWRAETAGLPATPIADQSAGGHMLYSSGTTGRPKGVRPALPANPDFLQLSSLAGTAQQFFGAGSDSIYLCPAPLYHAAPLHWCMGMQHLGGTVVVMEKYDPEEALRLIERYHVTHGQWVPTHFVRMLKLPAEIRAKYDVSSLKIAIHAAAPCPVPVKQAMIAWWGPILVEYYAGTEANGATIVDSATWLKKPGTVGRALVGKLHIVGESGEELPPRTEGLVYFEGEGKFAYHNDPAKTAEAYNEQGWSTLGDVGWLDEDGFLYLTDRKNFMIISGGVNIYPQEIENLLVIHPKVADVAVVGAPDPEMGEKVVAVIQPVTWTEAGEPLAAELLAWLRPQISGVKMPRQIDFLPELPRHATGKLYKRLLRDGYWGKRESRIV